MELKAEQVKKVLEHCSDWTAETGCKGCPYEDNCIDEDVTRDALAIINSQEQRIKELAEENERLINAGFDTVDYAIDRIREVKADTVRKYYSEVYEELLKVAACQIADEPNMRSQEVFAILEQKAKEMLEGDNERT